MTEAAELVEQVAYPHADLAVLINAGKALRDAGNYAASEKYYQKCIDIYKTKTTPEGSIILAHTGIAETYMAAGAIADALVHWNIILEIGKTSRSYDNFIVELATETIVKYTDIVTGEVLEEFLGPVKKIRFRTYSELAWFNASLGITYYSFNEPDSARKYLEKAVALADRIEDPEFVATVYLGLGIAQRALNDPIKAMQSFNAGYAHVRDSKSSYTKMELMTQIGDMYFSNGDYEQWSLFISEAYNQSVADNQHPEAAEIALNIAENSLLMGKREQTLIFLDKVIDGELPSYPVHRARAYAYRGDLREKQGNHDLALQDYLQALEVQRKSSTGDIVAVTLTKIADTYTKLGSYKKAEECLDEIVSIYANDLPARMHDIVISYRSNILYERGKLINSIEMYEPVHNSIKKQAYAELLAYNTGNLNLYQAEFRNNCQSFGDRLMEAYKKTGDSKYAWQAFMVSEESKSLLFNTVFKRYIASQSPAIPDDMRQKITAYNTLVLKKQSLVQEQLAMQATYVPSSNKELKQVDNQILKLSKEIYTSLPGLLEDDPDIADMHNVQFFLKTDEALISYRVGYDKLFIFVLTRHSFNQEIIPVGKADLRAQISDALNGINNVNKISDLLLFDPSKAYRLYEMLFQPIMPYLGAVDKIIVIPDDMLYTFPLEMLVVRTPGQSSQAKDATEPFLANYAKVHYLVDEHYSIKYTPSLTAFLMNKNMDVPAQWEKPLVAFADPDYEMLNSNMQAINISIEKSMVDSAGKVYFEAYKKPVKDVVFSRLEHTRQEALEIAQITQASNEDIYLGKRASERMLYEAPLSSARYVLFATHGIVPREDNGIPEPGLALAGDENSFGQSKYDGLLTASEIMGLRLTAEMVVLSACETAGDTTSAIQGEGFLGLTRAFIFAGASNLLVSHWSIESSATQKFISTLFREKIENQLPNDISLHTTKKWMRRQTADFPGHPSGKISYAHPFFWAPFVLVAARGN